jgi:hypothetical protein
MLSIQVIKISKRTTNNYCKLYHPHQIQKVTITVYKDTIYTNGFKVSFAICIKDKLCLHQCYDLGGAGVLFLFNDPPAPTLPKAIPKESITLKAVLIGGVGN